MERIQAQETAEEERKQARMRELTEQARERRETEAAEESRRKEQRDAKLRHKQEEKAEGEERLAKDSARRSWTASGGTEAAFEQAWPSMWEEMLKRRTVDVDRGRLKRWPEAAPASSNRRPPSVHEKRQSPVEPRAGRPRYPHSPFSRPRFLSSVQSACSREKAKNRNSAKFAYTEFCELRKESCNK